MKAAGFLDFATELRNPDFAKIADASGVLGLKADLPEEVRPGLARAFAHDGPALVEVAVNRQELVMPPSLTKEMIAGFGLFMLKAVLSGRGDEVVELVETNVFR
jgi:pyruvate dehydrogenase (quinone)